ncbi:MULTISPECIES: UDP-N-acetylmuramoyl-L-alanyl-D-glutamate--2,6-diaminopimelate ligase [unclassified Aureimonas]|uniref:UDP-N-acetylmuramoyl-L-alanyl-D-glutamate--2, 6-diaminopimelate ligase n=1 Tax=unclassified Aureimonas TaxID=2615206 RepID=UPI0006FD5230|nr:MULTISPECIES: UDP-N-acetylmuramoyl-L-alanyl-D-glutamate--2,6-diaminopimelate ligase [unclassified Aureimonas]KQT52830.1 UDP-N-acetylmuramoylalanyl-D-glutamate--2,6-diaminopimelate ligase [Aureimonas sp. Leaf427]KQT80290.1 UDP-N-acetylmuramoylalanyl-D-glutamate--2,6-diaminopimelate ligase [Aureimonas sp. Leaf460]
MKISDLAEGIASGAERLGTRIEGLSSDSRTVKPGYLFAALSGSRADGAGFVRDAEAKGAAAILAGAPVETALPLLVADDPRRALALMAARFHGRQPETIVAVTGTSGKTSIAAFTRQIWAQAGHAAASVGTTGIRSPTRDDYGSLTTPDPIELARVMAELAAEGVSHVAMEASSHGLDQRRLDGVTLAAGAFINLGRDHLDYHPTIEDYFAAKMRLFEVLLSRGAPAVIFADDPWSDRAIAIALHAGMRIETVGRKGTLLQLKRLEHERSRQIAEIEAEGRIHRVVLPLAGEFQMANALTAAGLAIVTGVPAETALGALEHLEGAPGRLDLAGTTASGVPVFVDYAHKPEALENVLSAVRPFTTGRVICVFGCGGDRDRGKRPIMGEIAARLADVAIVTDDNPRSEDPASIRAAIIEAAAGAEEIADRREAIRHAVGLSQAGDTIVVAGKGHEHGQTIGGQTLPFSDHEEVRRAIAGETE